MNELIYKLRFKKPLTDQEYELAHQGLTILSILSSYIDKHILMHDYGVLIGMNSEDKEYNRVRSWFMKYGKTNR